MINFQRENIVYELADKHLKLIRYGNILELKNSKWIVKFVLLPGLEGGHYLTVLSLLIKSIESKISNITTKYQTLNIKY